MQFYNLHIKWNNVEGNNYVPSICFSGGAKMKELRVQTLSNQRAPSQFRPNSPLCVRSMY